MKPSQAMAWLAVAWPTWTPYHRCLAVLYGIARFGATSAGYGRASLTLHAIGALYLTRTHRTAR